MAARKRPKRKAGGGQVVVLGVPKIDRALSRLSAKMQRTATRRAIRTALKLVEDGAKRRVPVDSGLTRNNISVRPGKPKRRGQIVVEVMIGEGDYKGQTFYAAFIEYGHKQGSRKLGKDRAEVPPIPFMRPAYSEEGPPAVELCEVLLLKEARDALRAMGWRGALSQVWKTSAKRTKKFRAKIKRGSKKAGKSAKRYRKKLVRSVNRTRKQAAKSVKRTRKQVLRSARQTRKGVARRVKVARKTIRKLL